MGSARGTEVKIEIREVFMAHPNADLISIADFAKATLQAPAFLRAQGAAVEMEDLIVSLRGRPVPRKGYEVVDVSDLSIGTSEGSYTEGDQIIVVHWLGDDDTPDGIKRIYRLPRNATYVQDEIGRLLFVVSRGFRPLFIDVKENILYDWVLDPPGVNPENENAFDMNISGTIDTPYRTTPADLNPPTPNFSAEAEGTQIGKVAAVVFPNPVQTGAFIQVDATTDIIQATVTITEQNETVIRSIYEGPLEQGTHLFFWDGYNAVGEEPAAGIYFARFSIDSDVGDIIASNTAARIDFQNANAESVSPDAFHLHAQLRYVVYTYANEMLNIESRPSKITQRERVYFWRGEGDSPLDFTVSTFLGLANEPDWATQINVYVSEKVIEEIDTTKAIETGLDFRRIGSLIKNADGSFENTLQNYEGMITSDSELLDSYEHDAPVDGFHTMGAYGVGLWGAANNRVYFNKIGNLGEQRIYALPSENALVPHSFPLPRSGQSPILHVHPAAHDSALIVFKRDAMHIIKGSGVISGLYDPQTIVEVDVDASHVIDGIGTMSPRSVLTVGGAVYFVGSDNRFYEYGINWRGQVDVRDVGLPIQQYLEDLTVAELENLVAFLYQNCYHLITPERVIILDMTRKYWASASWQLKDAFWSRGGVNAESILYGVLQDDTLVELFKGDTDNGAPIGGVWQSNPIAVPSEASITGVLCVHTTTPAPTVRVRVDIDDVEGVAEEFEPDKYNDYRHGIHGSGSRVSVRLETDEGFPLCDRIQLEVFVVP